MASNTVGTAVIKLSFDGKGVKAELDGVNKEIEASGSKSGKSFGSAWTVAAGTLMAKGIAKVRSVITSSMDRAIARVDTLNNSQKVFQAMGYSAEATAESMDTLNQYLDGLPTSMTDAVQGVQALSASFGGIEVGTKVFQAMNNAGLAFGATSEQVAGAINQLSQLSLDGPLDAATWNSLRNNGFTPVFTAMAKEAGKTVGELKGSFGKGELTVQDFINMLDKLNTEGSGDMESLSDLARANTEGIGTAMENVQNRIGKAIAKIIDAIGSEKIAGAINAFSSSFSHIADVIIGIFNFVSSNWSVISPILVAITTFFSGLLAMGIGAKVISFLTTTASMVAAHPILAIISAVAMGAMLIMQNWGPISEFFGNIFGAIGDFVRGAWEGIVNGAQAAWNAITGIFSNLANFFGSIFSGAWERVKAVFSTGGQIFMGIVDGILNAFKAIVNAIIGGINAVVAIPFNGINAAINGIRSIDIFGIKPFEWLGTINVPQIPMLAQGGYASGATSAVVGEAGAEVVLPLENNTDNWAGLLASTLIDQMEVDGIGGTGVTIEKQEFIINNQLDAEDIGRVMMQSIRRAA